MFNELIALMGPIGAFCIVAGSAGLVTIVVLTDMISHFHWETSRLAAVVTCVVSTVGGAAFQLAPHCKLLRKP